MANTKKETKTKIDISKSEPIDKEKRISTVKKISKKSADIIQKYNITAIVMICLALFIFSFIIAAQLNTVGNTNIISEGMREAELLRELQTTTEKYETLKEEYERSQEIVEEYKTSSATNDTLIASMKSDLEKANVLAGLATVKGEGVVVTLKDSTDVNMSAEAGLVHDTDLTAIVTELKAAGAEAISINGQRIIATTAIRCVGPTIQINSVKVASPFYIKAIGNSKYLESALNIRNGVVDSLKAYGIDVNIETDNKITIDKYDLTLKLQYATEVK